MNFIGAMAILSCCEINYAIRPDHSRSGEYRVTSCNTCDKMLAVQDLNGKIYLVGERIA